MDEDLELMTKVSKLIAKKYIENKISRERPSLLEDKVIYNSAVNFYVNNHFSKYNSLALSCIHETRRLLDNKSNSLDIYMEEISKLGCE